MDREEAHKIYYPISGVNLSGEKDLIDKIYDDFESRTCESCEYLEILCENEESIVFEMAINRKDFGCNKWKQK